VAAGLLAAALTGHHASAASQGAPSRAAAEAIAFARAQLGRPYLWGGTGPDAFDCSGLAMEAYAAAGISLQRTSEQQWASERHVSTPAAGDLVFFAGADGTPSSPGHVGIVVDPGRRVMIDAYASGWPVEYDTYGPGAAKGGLSPVVGFTDPAGGA
jgi:cell wall-associated NlpC family hydrolase